MNYYNNLAKKYFDETVNVNMNEHYEKFLPYLNKKDKILDVGCGSGRDSKFFIDTGYDVDSIDNSSDLALLASIYIGKKVIFKDVREVEYKNKYNAIWCNASLLHIMPHEISDVIGKLNSALTTNGVIYISLKEGLNEIVIEDGRKTVLYNYLDIIKILNSLGMTIKRYYISKDNMCRNLNWFTIIAQK